MNATPQRSQREYLESLRDEIRLELHLAGMELRDEWQNIERKLPQYLRDTASQGVDTVVAELRRFQERLRREPPRPGWPG